MSKTIDFPTPELAVTVISIEDTNKILTIFNPRWGSFTLPMTKRKKWIDPEVPAGNRHEDLVLSATRAAAEALGKTLPANSPPQLLLKEIDYRQSDSEGVWKVYLLNIFGLRVPSGAVLTPDTTVEWLSPHDFAAREPISPTARYVIACLGREGKLPQ